MLDTNMVGELIRHPFGGVAQRTRSAGDTVSISIIVAVELRFGCAKKASPRLSRQVEDILAAVTVLPFDEPADFAYGSIRAELEAAGRLIGSNDLLIAAHARALRATLVTANEREFRHVSGLAMENWPA